jgi:hypothetical protein
MTDAMQGERERKLRAALERIIGMCDVPPRCTCGRPNGLPAVVACARSALDATPGQAPDTEEAR